MKEDPFLEWLEEQDYYIGNEVVEEKWPDAEFESSKGVTNIIGDDGEVLTPKRDFRNLYIRGTA